MAPLSRAPRPVRRRGRMRRSHGSGRCSGSRGERQPRRANFGPLEIPRLAWRVSGGATENREAAPWVRRHYGWLRRGGWRLLSIGLLQYIAHQHGVAIVKELPGGGEKNDVFVERGRADQFHSAVAVGRQVLEPGPQRWSIVVDRPLPD